MSNVDANEINAKNLYLATISKDGELFAVKKGFDKELIFRGPFSSMNEFNIVVKISCLIGYIILFRLVYILIWFADANIAMHIPLSRYINLGISFIVSNSISSLFLYNLKKALLQITKRPSVEVEAIDPDNALVIACDQLHAMNEKSE